MRLKNVIPALIVLVMVLFLTGNIFAQVEEKDIIVKIGPGEEQGMPFMPMIPGLTESQRNDMKDIHIKAQKEILPLNNEIGEKEARLRTLTTVDNPDITEINKYIEEIGDIRTKIKKIEMNAHLSIRKILNDEQRLMFDTMPPPMMHPHPPMIHKEIKKIEKIEK